MRSVELVAAVAAQLDSVAASHGYSVYTVYTHTAVYAAVDPRDAVADASPAATWTPGRP